MKGRFLRAIISKAERVVDTLLLHGLGEPLQGAVRGEGLIYRSGKPLGEITGDDEPTAAQAWELLTSMSVRYGLTFCYSQRSTLKTDRYY